MVRGNQFSGLAIVRRCAVAVILVGLGIYSSSCARTISGVIVDEAGIAISETSARINITRIDQGKNDSQIVEVDENGEFTVEGELDAGIYLVEALVPGYRIYSKRVNLEKSMSLTMNLAPFPKKIQSIIDAYMQVNSSSGEGNAKISPPKM